MIGAATAYLATVYRYRCELQLLLATNSHRGHRGPVQGQSQMNKAINCDFSATFSRVFQPSLRLCVSVVHFLANFFLESFRKDRKSSSAIPILIVIVSLYSCIGKQRMAEATATNGRTSLVGWIAGPMVGTVLGI